MNVYSRLVMMWRNSLSLVIISSHWLWFLSRKHCAFYRWYKAFSQDILTVWAFIPHSYDILMYLWIQFINNSLAHILVWCFISFFWGKVLELSNNFLLNGYLSLGNILCKLSESIPYIFCLFVCLFIPKEKMVHRMWYNI